MTTDHQPDPPAPRHRARPPGALRNSLAAGAAALLVAALAPMALAKGPSGPAPATVARPIAPASETTGAKSAQLPGPPAPRAHPRLRAPRTDDARFAGGIATPLDAASGAANSSASPARAAAAPAIAAPAATPAVATTLVLYDTTSQWGWLGELYAEQTANLVSHFGTWKAKPVSQYAAGDMAGYAAVVYLGSTFDEPLPTAFLNDVLVGSRPVLWVDANIWQLVSQDPTFAADHGFTTTFYDTSPISQVTYKGTTLDRDLLNQGGVMQTQVTDPTKATVLGTANRSDGTTLPWAVRSGNLTYVAEIPFSYVGSNDRYLAFSDLLFDLLAPGTADRHRALVRIEDVGPDADPAELTAVADVLFARKIPFSVAVYTGYRDPLGVTNNGVAQSFDLSSRPQVVTALKYMQSKGGTLIMHGYTHQYSNLSPAQACPDVPNKTGPCNPYSGQSADDFEFFHAHVDASNNVVYDGPVNGDSATFANGRITSAFTQFSLAGLGTPKIFEPPHYAASPVDYKAIAPRFTARYDRGLYFGGLLSGGPVNTSRLNGQFFPYAVKDLYGSLVIPENLGNVEPVAFNNHPPRLPADIIATAQKNLVVRDGFASFFYHPYLGTAYLTQVLDGVGALGYSFVAAGSVTLP